MDKGRVKLGGLLALVLGATGIGLAPILVRLSETGPVATGFYRILLAQPIVWLLLRHSQGEARERTAGNDFWWAALAGLCFAGDLAVWHWSIQLTTVANSTLFTNFAPFFVILGARAFFHERITTRLLVGMAIAFGGGFLLVAESFHLAARYLLGDALALVTAIFYASYLLVVKRLRRTRSVWYVMAWSGLCTAPILFAIGALSNESMLPASKFGWLVLIALALVSHVGGQGLIAYGLAHISASVSAVLLMWQSVIAAVLAWWILHEAITPLRVVGGLVIILGIFAGTWQGKSPGKVQ